jgi:hypothetical protein
MPAAKFRHLYAKNMSELLNTNGGTSSVARAVIMMFLHLKTKSLEITRGPYLAAVIKSAFLCYMRFMGISPKL